MSTQLHDLVLSGFQSDGLSLELPPDAFAPNGDSQAPDPAIEALRHQRALGRGVPRPGSIIDKYRLEEVLGVGAFAVVYRATHMLLRAPVAIKLLQPRLAEKQPSIADMLCEEARFAAQVDNPNIVRVFDVTKTTQLTYVVMEFIDGVSLDEQLRRRGRLPIARAAEIGDNVCSGLDAALAVGLVHRDIKPANILLPRKGNAKVVDLGLATLGSQSTAPSDDEAPKTVGTPGYMAPEQFIDARWVDYRADVYALGATLYHATVGAPPFPLDEPRRILELQQKQEFTRPSEIQPDFDTDFEELLMRMLSAAPDARPTSYMGIATRLKSIIGRQEQSMTED